MFGHGGLSTLGVNTLIMYLPALFIYGGFRLAVKRLKNKKTLLSIVSGFLAGAGVLLASFLVFIVLLLSGEEYTGVAVVFSVSYAVLSLVEALLTFLIIRQILNIKPEMVPGVL